MSTYAVVAAWVKNGIFYDEQVISLASSPEKAKKHLKNLLHGENELPKKDRRVFKVVRGDSKQYSILVNEYLVYEHKNSIKKDIQAKWGGNESKAIAYAWQTFLNSHSAENILSINIDDFNIKMNSREEVSIRYHAVTKIYEVSGTISGEEINVTYIGETLSA